MRIPLPGLLLTSCLLLAVNINPAQAVPTVSATETATFPNHGDAYARQNDIITYTVTISDSGTDATGVQFSNPTPANTTDVAGSLNATPVAVDDTYPQTVYANTTVNTATSGFSAVTNDFPGFSAGNPVAISALTITAFDATSLNGGIVTMTTSGANVGRFTYAAPPGFTGTDSFTYTISNGVAGTPAGSATAKVTITVSGPVIWFVDSTAPGGGNGTWTGTNAKAFQTVAQAAAVDAANHRIFVLNNSGSTINYADGLTMLSGEWLIGQGATNSPTNTFDALMGITYGTDTAPRPSIGGVRPTLQGTVTLETNARVQGLNLFTATATGMNDPAGAITGVTVSEVSITTTTGTAVLLSSTGGTFTFTSISANGAANGISLTSTTGSFTVTGSGNTSVGGDNSGGTIQNTTSHGIALTATNNTSFTNVKIQNTVGSGIKGVNPGGGSQVTGFAFQNGFIDNTGTGGGVDESNIAFDSIPSANELNLSGTVAITKNNLTNSRYHGVDIEQFNGTIGSLNISNNTFTSSTSGASSLGSAVRIQVRGTAAVAGNITGATINNNTITNFPGGAGILVQVGNGTSSSAPGCVLGTVATPLIITGNLVAGPAGTNMATQAINAAIDGVGTSQFDISNNGTVAQPLANTQGVTVAFSAFGKSTASGTMNGNHINQNSTVNGQPGIAVGVDQHFAVTDTPSLTIKLDGNVIQNTQGNGILAKSSSSVGTLNVTITNNNVAAPLGGVRPGIRVDSGNNTAGESSTVCADIRTNISAGSGGTNGIGLRLQSANASDHFGVEGMAATSSPGVESYVSGLNPNGNGVLLISATTGFSNCSSAPLFFAPGGVERTDLKSPDDTAAATSVSVAHPVSGPENKPAVTAKAAPVAPAFPPGLLTQADLDSVVATAMARWEATGLLADQVTTLRKLQFEVADLPDLRLGEAEGTQIRVDRDAGGNGWYIGSDNRDDNQFASATSGTRRYTDSANTPAGRIDLLTAIMHEMGHALGLSDSYLEQDRDSLMYGYLTKGERRLPAKNQALGAKPSADGAAHFLGSPVVIGTLPAGKGVKITFQNTISAAVPTITSQGTVSGTNFSSVLTDDPGVGGASDPTVVPVAFPPTSFSAASPPNGKKNTVYAGYNFVANGNPAPTYTMQSGTFPPGLSLSTGGALTGTPTSSGLFSSLVVRATNVAGFADTAAFSIAINDPPAFTSANSTTFTVGTNGNFQLTASGYPTTFTFTNTGNSLPSGVTLTSAGLLSGTPAAGTGGSYSLTFQADNGISPAATQSFTLTVNQAPAITSASSTTFTVGMAGTFTATATGFPPPTFSETGALPSGVTLSSGGVLSGTPNADTDGSYPFTLKASNGVGTDATQSFTLTVNPVTCTPAPANMISWWAGDGNASDLVGGHDGTLAGGATANATGEVDKAFQFLGNAEVVNVPNSSVYDFGANPFTIDTWVKFTSVSGSDVFVAHDEGTGFVNKWIFWLKTGNLAMHFDGPAVGGAVDFGVPFAPTTGVWYHIAVTRSGSTYKFYVNGAQISPDQTNAATVPPANAQLTLGKAEALASLNGFLDEVEIFNRALTAPELAGIYYAGRFGKCSPPLQLSSAVSEKTHGGAGTFDVALPLTGPPGIECRSGPVAGEHKLIFTFSNAVVSGNASVLSGTGSVSGSPIFAGKTMTVNLTGVSNAQHLTVKLSGVTDAVAQVLPDTNVNMDVLFGDVNSSKRTDSGDVTVVRNQTVLIPDQSTCRFDVNTDGRIDAGDVTATRNATVTVLP